MILDVDNVSPYIFETVIPDILELPILKSNLEELEIEGSDWPNLMRFTENWNNYYEYAKLSQVTFCSIGLTTYDIFKLKAKMKMYFREFKLGYDSLMCSVKNHQKAKV